MVNRLRFTAMAMLMLMVAAAPSFAAEKKGKGVEGMSDEQLIKLAQSGAPSEISKEAGVQVIGEDGKLKELKKGTNGFTCLPFVDNKKDPDPMCMDPAATQWASDFIGGAPKPTNTEAGIAYMAKGGWHWQKNGKVLMKEEPGAKLMKDPPHWMIFFPFEAKKSGLPPAPNKGGVYIMFEETPYSHLMVMQNPSKIPVKLK